MVCLYLGMLVIDLAITDDNAKSLATTFIYLLFKLLMLQILHSTLPEI